MVWLFDQIIYEEMGFFRIIIAEVVWGGYQLTWCRLTRWSVAVVQDGSVRKTYVARVRGRFPSSDPEAQAAWGEQTVHIHALYFHGLPLVAPCFLVGPSSTVHLANSRVRGKDMVHDHLLSICFFPCLFLYFIMCFGCMPKV